MINLFKLSNSIISILNKYSYIYLFLYTFTNPSSWFPEFSTKISSLTPPNKSSTSRPSSAATIMDLSPLSPQRAKEPSSGMSKVSFVSIFRQPILRSRWRNRSLQPRTLPSKDSRRIHRPGPETHSHWQSHLPRPTRPFGKETPWTLRLWQVHLHEWRRRIWRNRRQVCPKMGLQRQESPRR